MKFRKYVGTQTPSRIIDVEQTGKQRRLGKLGKGRRTDKTKWHQTSKSHASLYAPVVRLA